MSEQAILLGDRLGIKQPENPARHPSSTPLPRCLIGREGVEDEWHNFTGAMPQLGQIESVSEDYVVNVSNDVLIVIDGRLAQCSPVPKKDSMFIAYRLPGDAIFNAPSEELIFEAYSKATLIRLPYDKLDQIKSEHPILMDLLDATLRHDLNFRVNQHYINQNYDSLTALHAHINAIKNVPNLKRFPSGETLIPKKELRKITGLKMRTFTYHLKQLCDQGVIHMNGKYSLSVV